MDPKLSNPLADAERLRRLEEASQEKQQRLAVNVAQKSVDAASRKMMDAITQTRTYEKLKERAFEEFLQEENRAESKEIDQLNSYRSARNVQ